MKVMGNLDLQRLDSAHGNPINGAATPQIEDQRVQTDVTCVKKVAHLTSVHAAHDGRIFQKECRSLSKAGYEVILIAPHSKREIIDGVRIEPVSQSVSRGRRMTVTMTQVLGKAMKVKADVYHFHDPELLPVGVFLKAAGKRVIYDAHENFAKDILNKQWMASGLRRLVSKAGETFEGVSSRLFDAVVAATPGIADIFPQRTTVLVQNYPRPQDFIPVTSIPFSLRDNAVFYLGGIEVLKGAREMVAAMALVPETLNVKLLLAGTIDRQELAAELADSPGWQRTRHLGFLDRPAAAKVAGAARVGLVLFHPAPNYEDSQPNKLFEYMSAGLPLIASHFPHWRQLIDEIGCGLTVDPLNPQEIARAITWILENPSQAEAMGRRGQTAVASTYNWKTQERTLLQLYQRILQ